MEIEETDLKEWSHNYEYDPDKPLGILFFSFRRRSPNFTRMYHRMASGDWPIQWHLVVDDVTPNPRHLGQIITDELNGRAPDFVFDGFGAGNGSLNSQDWINNPANHISLIRTVGDPDTHNSVFPNQDKFLNTSYFYVPWAKDCRGTDTIRRHLILYPRQTNAKMLYIPTLMDKHINYDLSINRDIDVGYYGTIDMPKSGSGGWRKHRNRLEMDMASTRYCQDHGFVYDNTNVYENAYIDMLNRTKIHLVDTSKTGIMVDKYFEAACSGCLVMGEKPQGMDDVFIDGETFVEINMNKIKTELPKKLEYWLRHDTEREKVAKKLQKIVWDRYDMDKGIKQFCDRLLKDWTPREKPVYKCLCCGKVDKWVYTDYGVSIKGLMNNRTVVGRICPTCSPQVFGFISQQTRLFESQFEEGKKDERVQGNSSSGP